MGIPVVAIADTNCDPDDIDYIIPGNDDAVRAIRLFCSRLSDACVEGHNRAEERLKAEAKLSEQVEVEPTDTAAAGEGEEGGPEIIVISKKDETENETEEENNEE